MTAAPLPAPLPANCPLCNEPITWGDELWIHTDTDRCFLDGTTLHNDEEVRLWNRRAPEAQAWRPIESAPDETTVLVSGLAYNTGPDRFVAVAARCGGGWFEEGAEEGETLYPPTHWQPLPAPPGAPVPAPAAADAAVEALEAALAAMSAHEAWEADIILHADWETVDGAPHLTQEQMDALNPVQDARNAALAKVSAALAAADAGGAK